MVHFKAIIISAHIIAFDGDLALRWIGIECQYLRSAAIRDDSVPIEIIRSIEWSLIGIE